MGEFGYSGKILSVDLSGGRHTDLATSDYADEFVGGRGIAAKLFWDNTPPNAAAFDPENCLICATGPVTGVFRTGRMSMGDMRQVSLGAT